MYSLAKENKAILFNQAWAHLPLDQSALNRIWILLHFNYFDVVSTDEEEVVPKKLKKSAKQTDNVASKEVQQVKERYLSSFSFIIFDISAPNHGVHLDHKILVWRSIWLLLKLSS